MPPVGTYPVAGPARAPVWRAYGQGPDLDLDLRAADRGTLVTRLLAGCRLEEGSDPEGPTWEFSLSGRIGALAEILALTQDRDALAARFACPGCGQAFEAELSLARLAELGQEAQAAPLLDLDLADGGHCQVRRPTGADQRRWQQRGEREAGAMLAELWVSGPDPAALLPQVAEAMADQDLLAAFRVHCACPQCGREADLPLDLEGWLLAHLEAHRHKLLWQVHRLASRYGWAEAQILALPRERRAAYLELLDREAGWS